MAAHTVTIFDSSHHPESSDEGYEIAIAYGADGKQEAVAFMDLEMQDIFETSPRMALLMARQIIANVVDPDETAH